ncbi:LPXTG cell wall anchor domain-containing protein [Bifidobacterium myosotis]|uniref:LPXTG cell wall anchor domain-containing protein n=1 Tax=Bifidobacterium myosotis TaxID=1630166 RepID=A0A5M9ZKZ9_9BIFI|nr:LPXTG cell wall anchor domain-containing protein [Bifidobacterium myosotis]KAA8828198.1 LPXTG cell wall anchor domain-containing protein [Bifidobacterium myosotis]
MRNRKTIIAIAIAATLGVAPMIALPAAYAAEADPTVTVQTEPVDDAMQVAPVADEQTTDKPAPGLNGVEVDAGFQWPSDLTIRYIQTTASGDKELGLGKIVSTGPNSIPVAVANATDKIVLKNLPAGYSQRWDNDNNKLTILQGDDQGGSKGASVTFTREKPKPEDPATDYTADELKYLTDNTKIMSAIIPGFDATTDTYWNQPESNLDIAAAAAPGADTILKDSPVQVANYGWVDAGVLSQTKPDDGRKDLAYAVTIKGKTSGYARTYTLHTGSKPATTVPDNNNGNGNQNNNGGNDDQNQAKLHTYDFDLKTVTAHHDATGSRILGIVATTGDAPKALLNDGTPDAKYTVASQYVAVDPGVYEITYTNDDPDGAKVANGTIYTRGETDKDGVFGSASDAKATTLAVSVAGYKPTTETDKAVETQTVTLPEGAYINVNAPDDAGVLHLKETKSLAGQKTDDKDKADDKAQDTLPNTGVASMAAVAGLGLTLTGAAGAGAVRLRRRD